MRPVSLSAENARFLDRLRRRVKGNRISDTALVNAVVDCVRCRTDTTEPVAFLEEDLDDAALPASLGALRSEDHTKAFVKAVAHLLLQDR